jgi:coenzyme F420-reducing hydrogenase gamma subunit
MAALVRHESSAVTAELQPRRLSLIRRGSCAASQSLCQHVNTAAVTYSAMASSTVTTTFTGPGNQGLQVGYNSGSIQTHIHAPGTCPPTSALTDTVLTTLFCTERPETPPQPSCFVPFRRDPDFVDRGTLLDQVRERCAAPASRVALVGLGGVG